MTTRQETEIANLIFQIFGGNPYHAVAREVNTDIIYSPRETPLSEELILGHLHGDEKLGSYQLINGADVVRWLGWDIDSVDLETAREYVLKITKHLTSVNYCVEFSGGKGYHVLIFLDEPMRASDAKKVVDAVRDAEQFKKSGESHVECYPKQAQLTKLQPKGSLLKLPLGFHPRTGLRSKFVNIDEGWENGPTLDPVEIMKFKCPIENVLVLINSGPGPIKELVNLLSQYWKDGNRHEISLYLAGYLAHENWGIDEAKKLVADICLATGDDEVYNREQTVESTFIKFKEGKTVKGRQGLGDILPVSAMQKLTELVAFLRAPDTVTQIDDIRLDHTRSKLENVRLATNTIWSILNDDGCRIFQTPDGLAYWYDATTHLITVEQSEPWFALLNKQFGLNGQDNFSKLVYAELRYRVVRESPIVKVQNRTFWNEQTNQLLLNLGGPEVYILDGKEIQTSYNGECGYMFLTSPNQVFIQPDFGSPTVDSWDYLVNDLSFVESKEALAKPDEQKELLKAWVLAFFFQELMPTKPILSMLGQPGSGKTTAMRRLLRILEDPEGDVLGIAIDKQDGFRASIASHRLLVMDNLEKSGAGWMVDILNKLSTGNNIELRELYKTNAKFTITPRCFVAITAVNMPFSEETLFSRLLVLEMQKIMEPLPEYLLQRRIRESGPLIWGDLMRKLNTVVAEIHRNSTVKPPTKSRLVDFTVFCARIKNLPLDIIDGEKLMLGLMAMVDMQMRQLKESSQAIQLLEEWITYKPDEAQEWHSFMELYSILQGMAQARKEDFKWKNYSALDRHLTTLEDRLRTEFGAETTVDIFLGKETKKIRFINMLTDINGDNHNGSHSV